MAEDDFTPSDLAATEHGSTVGDEHKGSDVDLWHAHPKPQPAVPYHTLTTKPDRRRPENATIRRWMSLADQVLNGEPVQDASSDKPEPRSKNSGG